MSNFWPCFDIPMAIFRRVRRVVHANCTQHTNNQGRMYQCTDGWNVSVDELMLSSCTDPPQRLANGLIEPGMSNLAYTFRSNWSQIGQIWYFLRSVLVHFG